MAKGMGQGRKHTGLVQRGMTMNGSPQWKVYDGYGFYKAACKVLEDAAAVVANYDNGTIRLGHAKKNAVWTEGHDGNAGDSYDAVAELAIKRTGRTATGQDATAV